MSLQLNSDKVFWFWTGSLELCGEYFRDFYIMRAQWAHSVSLCGPIVYQVIIQLKKHEKSPQNMKKKIF